MNYDCIKNVINSKRLPVLFIGSGMSKRYLRNSPTWEELLKECFLIFDPTGIMYSQSIDQCRRDRLSTFDTLQYLGTKAEEFYNTYYFGKLKEDPSKTPTWIRNISPFKMHIRDRFKKMILKPNGYLQKEMRLLRQLNEKIAAVITTNYDTFIESHLFNENFEVYYKQSDMFKSERFNIAEIYKIHGSIEDAASLVITKDDYYDFKKNRRLIVAKMLTLFSDSPIIFLGYSLEDENIKSIILDFLECIDHDDIPKLKNHFIFIEYKKDEKGLIETTENIVTDRGYIPITKISTDNYSRLFFELNKITPGLPSNIVKQTKRLVKRIVENSLITGSTDAIIIDEDQIDLLEGNNLAVAFGERSSLLSKYGYSTFDLKYLFEDILFDNKNYNPEFVIDRRLKGVSYLTLIPIYKYYCKLDETKRSSYDHMNKFLVRNSYETIYGNNITRNLNTIPILNNLNQIENYVLDKQLEKIDLIFKVISKNLMNLTASDIRKICIDYFNVSQTECLTSTYFKRCVMYLDLIENKKT